MNIVNQKFQERQIVSEGELFLRDYFDDNSIIYESEVKIENLKGDSKTYRIADFYLEEYKVYVEFFGQWNHEENKARYLEKKKVYKSNRIACIFLYPENLGIIDFIFHKRITLVLKYHQFKRQLFIWRTKRIWDKHAIKIILLGICSYVSFRHLRNPVDYETAIVFGIVSFAIAWFLFVEIKKICK